MEQQLNCLDPSPTMVDFNVKALYNSTPKTKAKVEANNIPPPLDLNENK